VGISTPASQHNRAGVHRRLRPTSPTAPSRLSPPMTAKPNHSAPPATARIPGKTSIACDAGLIGARRSTMAPVLDRAFWRGPARHELSVELSSSVIAIGKHVRNLRGKST